MGSEARRLYSGGGGFAEAFGATTEELLLSVQVTSETFVTNSKLLD